MPTYDITDPDTGITLSLTGEAPPQEADVQAVFNYYYSGPGAEMVSPAPSVPEPMAAIPEVATPQTGVEWADVPVQAAKSFLPSLGRVGESIYQAATNPLDTLSSLGNLSVGLAFKAGNLLAGEDKPPMTERERTGVTLVDTIWDDLKKTYGTEEGFKEALAKDPARVLMDAATLLTGGGAAAAKVPGLARAGAAASRAGAAIDPITLVGRGLVGAAKSLKTPVKQVLAAGTGASEMALSGIYRGRPGVRAAMREGLEGVDILDPAKRGLEAIRAQRAAEYRPRLEAMRQMSTQIDFAPVKAQLKELMDEWGVKLTQSPDGGYALDTSRASVSLADEAKMAKTIGLIMDWGSQPGDMTPLVLDRLKRKLDSMYSPNSSERAFTNTMADSVRQLLRENVPGYAAMTQDYATITNTLKEVEKGLSLGTKASADTAIRKLISTAKDDEGFRRGLAQTLEEAAGEPIVSKALGSQLHTVIPRGLMGKLSTAAIMAGGGLGAYSIFGPAGLAVLAAASPRLVGELLNVAGLPARTLAKIKGQMSPMALARMRQGAAAGLRNAPVALYQTGKVGQTDNYLERTPQLTR